MITALSLITLSMIGFTYALWSETLTISGSIATGEVDWEYVEWNSRDPLGIGMLDYNCRPGFVGPAPLTWQTGKDVGWTVLTLMDSHTLKLEFHNVYPCYFEEIAVYASNTGTVPLIFDGVTITGGAQQITLRASPTPSTIPFDLDGDGFYDIEIWWGNGFGYQFHPGDRGPELSFWFHVLQEAPQDATLTFSLTLTAVQYNEYEP